MNTRITRTAAIALTATVAALTCVGCATPDLVSGLSIPPGQTFNLGGGQTGDYAANVLNHGETTVTLFTVTPTGGTTQLAQLEPGQQQSLDMDPNAPMMLRNESNARTAELRVEVNGDTNLAMYYTDNDAK